MDHWVARLLHVLLTLGCAYGQDVFNTMPPPVNTSFTCRGRDTGFYADAETNCRVYHTCDDHGNKFTYYCPEETAFRQEALVCDHAHLVDCAAGRRVAKHFGDFDNDDNDDNDEVDDDTENERSADHRRRSSFGDDGGSLDVFRSGNANPAYTRSFRITAEPPSSSSGFPAPKSRSDASKSRPSPTFVLNSSVYFRDRGVLGKADVAMSRDNVGVFAGKTTPTTTTTTTTTTLGPYRDDLESPGDFRYRFFDGKTKDGRKKDENRDGFSSGFATFSTTFRPFDADLKVKPGDHTMDWRSSGADARNEERGSFGGIATTLRPFGAGFKVSEQAKGARDFGYRNSGKKDDSVDRSSATFSTTFRPFGADFKPRPGDLRGFGKVKHDKGEDSGVAGREEFTGHGNKALRGEDKGRGERKDQSDGGGVEGRNGGGFVAKGNERSSSSSSSSSFFFGNENFPYSETLRSMQQAQSGKSSSTTSAPVTTAGTEFPVHPFAGSLSPLVPNELEDDPYYPRRPTTTEAYYRWTDSDKGAKRPYRFSTRRPWPGSLDFEIPEVLPDLNTLDDLVDRRKLFFIPRVKAT